jgi:hypothetical protein
VSGAVVLGCPSVKNDALYAGIVAMALRGKAGGRATLPVYVLLHSGSGSTRDLRLCAQADSRALGDLAYQWRAAQGYTPPQEALASSLGALEAQASFVAKGGAAVTSPAEFAWAEAN